MFDGIKARWSNRGERCIKCQKKLVAKEKYLCQKCKNDLGITGEVTLGVLALYGLSKIPKIVKHNKG